jgi:hypothetical protein
MYALLITTCIYRCWQCYHSQPVQRKEGYHNLTRLKQAIIAHNCHFLPFSFSLLLQELHRLLWWGYHEHLTDFALNHMNRSTCFYVFPFSSQSTTSGIAWIAIGFILLLVV